MEGLEGIPAVSTAQETGNQPPGEEEESDQELRIKKGEVRSAMTM